MIEYDLNSGNARYISSIPGVAETRSFFECFKLVRDQILLDGRSKEFPTYRSIFNAIFEYNFNGRESGDKLSANVIEMIWWNAKMSQIHKQEGDWEICDPVQDYLKLYGWY
ncbi:MAG: hypothetical protein JHC38_06030 [Thiotrichales bacterium]|nr:hypothetical protein [Thiotrichales bacterium]